MVKLVHLQENEFESCGNELCAEGWSLVSVFPFPFATDNTMPVYVTVWEK